MSYTKLTTGIWGAVTLMVEINDAIRVAPPVKPGDPAPCQSITGFGVFDEYIDSRDVTTIDPSVAGGPWGPAEINALGAVNHPCNVVLKAGLTNGTGDAYANAAAVLASWTANHDLHAIQIIFDSYKPETAETGDQAEVAPGV